MCSQIYDSNLGTMLKFQYYRLQLPEATLGNEGRGQVLWQVLEGLT